MIFWFSWVPALYPLFLWLWRHGKAKLSSRLPLPMLETKLHANCLMLREGPHLYSTPRSCVHQQRSARPGQPRRGQSPGRGKAKSFAVLPGVGRSQEPSCPHWGKELAGRKAFWKSTVRETAAWHCGCRCLLWALLGFPHIVLLKARPGGDGFQTLKVPRCGCTVSGLNAKPRCCVCGVTSKSHGDRTWPL